MFEVTTMPKGNGRGDGEKGDKQGKEMGIKITMSLYGNVSCCVVEDLSEANTVYATHVQM